MLLEQRICSVGIANYLLKESMRQAQIKTNSDVALDLADTFDEQLQVSHMTGLDYKGVHLFQHALACVANWSRM